MSKTINKQPCSKCGSKDNLLTWEYEGRLITQCKTPSCHNRVNQSPTQAQNVPTGISYQKEHQDFIVGEFKETRGLTEDTCRLLGIMCQEDRHIFQYNNSQKVRLPLVPKKKFFWINYSKDSGLFGEHLDYDYSKEIIITEGEFDAASLVQVGFQAYSINSGAKSGEQEIEAKIAKLSKFKEIILWLDPDEDGQACLKKILNISNFPIEKTRIVNSKEFKDANEVLLKAPKLLTHFIEDSEDFVPEGVIFGDKIDFSELEKVEEPGYPFPFSGMQEAYHGLRETEVLLIGAGSGSGKSLFAKTLVLYWMKHVKNIRIANVFLEERQKFTVKSLLALDLKIPAYKLVENPYEGLEEQGRALLGSKRYIFEDHFGSLDSKSFFKKLRYLAHKVDVIILDHISIVLSGLESEEGERKDLDRLMTRIKTLANETGVRVVLISHLRRPQGEKGYEDGLPVTPNSFRSSHSLYQLSDSVISLERNQQSQTDKNKVLCRGLKNRFKGDLGILDTFYFNSDTGTLQTLDQIFEV